MIGQSRKIQECVNIIKLKFIIEEVEDSKVQALRNNAGI